MTKAIVFGDDPAGHTGFGRVTHHLVRAARATDVEPVVVPLKSRPELAYDDARRVPPAEEAQPWEPVAQLLRDEQPALLLSVGDSWDIQGLAHLRQQYPCRWLASTPVDTTPYPRYVLLVREPRQYLDVSPALAAMDRIVAWTDFGAEAVAAMLRAAIPAPPDGEPPIPPIDTIPLGVDPERFAPRPRTEARQVFGGGVPEDDLLFTCIKVNSERAGFDTLLAAWARYLALAMDVDPALATRSKLYLHTAIEGFHSIPLLMARHGIQPTILLNPGLAPGAGVTEDEIAAVHASTDIALSAARGEGFGLPILEAMACGVPCVVPDYGGPASFGGEGVVRVPVAASHHPEFAVTDFAIADEGALAEALLALATDPARRARIGDAGHTVAAGLSWGRFEERWTALIREELESAQDPSTP